MDYSFVTFLIIACVIAFPFLYASWRQSRLIPETFLRMGFIKVEQDQKTDSPMLHHFGISGKTFYQGRYKGQLLKVYNTVINTADKQFKEIYIIEMAQTHKYEGVELATQDLADEPRVFPSSWRRVSLEAEQFNKAYLIYSDNDSNQFYDLNPETMSKLLDLRPRLSNNVIATEQRSLFVCYLIQPLIGAWFIVQMLTGKQVIRQQIENFLETALEVNLAFENGTAIINA